MAYDAVSGVKRTDIAIGYKYGTLSVVPRKVTITTGSKIQSISETTNLVCYDYKFAGGLEGDSVSVTFNQALRSEGVVSNTVDESKTKIFDKSGKDVTKNYAIEYEYGILVLYP